MISLGLTLVRSLCCVRCRHEGPDSSRHIHPKDKQVSKPVLGQGRCAFVMDDVVANTANHLPQDISDADWRPSVQL